MTTLVSTFCFLSVCIEVRGTGDWKTVRFLYDVVPTNAMTCCGLHDMMPANVHHMRVAGKQTVVPENMEEPVNAFDEAY